MATTDTELVSLDELLDARQLAVDNLAEVQDLIAREGPLTLAFEIGSIRQDAEAVLSRLDNLLAMVRNAGIDVMQVTE